MSFFKDHPSIIQSNIEKKVKTVLGKKPGLACALVDQLGEKAALRVLKAAEKLSDERNRRTQYVRACIEKPRRIAELERKLADMPDPYDNLSPEEMRELDPDELRDYMRQRYQAELELSVLQGEKPGGVLLAGRVGREAAIKLTYEAFMAVGQKRANVILANAAKPNIKYPERYIRAALNEHRND